MVDLAGGGRLAAAAGPGAVPVAADDGAAQVGRDGVGGGAGVQGEAGCRAARRRGLRGRRAGRRLRGGRVLLPRPWTARPGRPLRPPRCRVMRFACATGGVVLALVGAWAEQEGGESVEDVGVDRS